MGDHQKHAHYLYPSAYELTNCTILGLIGDQALRKEEPAD